MKKIAVIADDLTGANATGVLLSKHGFSTATILQGFLSQPFNYDAICIDTDSRYISKKAAYQSVSKIASAMLAQGVELLCKRIDSTARGNIGAEIDAILDCIGDHSVAIVMPSYPSSGRTTVGSYLLVDGVPVQETDVGKDPQSPLKDSYIPWIISSQSERKIGCIELNEVLGGKNMIARKISELVDSGCRIIVIDAVTEKHIEETASAMAEWKTCFVPVDPGPLTAAYAKKKYGNDVKTPKLLVSIGSCTSVTERQIGHLIQKMNVQPVYIDPGKLANADLNVRNDELLRGVEEGLLRTKTESVILVTTNQPDQPLLDLKALASKQNTTQESLARKITDGLALISQRIIQGSETAISGCFTSGGDVTASICAASRAHGIQLMDEVFPLAAYGRFAGGYLDGMPVITKGGLIGGADAITVCIRYLFKQLSKSKDIKENMS